MQRAELAQTKFFSPGTPATHAEKYFKRDKYKNKKINQNAVLPKVIALILTLALGLGLYEHSFDSSLAYQTKTLDRASAPAALATKTDKVYALESEVNYKLENVFKHYHVLRNGNVEVAVQYDLLTSDRVGSLELEIPHLYGQSIWLNSVEVGEIADDKTGINYFTARRSNNPESATLNSYSIKQSRESFDIKLNTAFPINARRRILLKYTIYNPTIRYQDIGQTNLVIQADNKAIDIDKCEIVISFAGRTLRKDSEYKQYAQFEHNNLPQLENVFQSVEPEKLDKFMPVPDETGSLLASLSSLAFANTAEKINSTTRVDFRIIYPSYWVALADISLTPEGYANARTMVKEEEEAYDRHLRQVYIYRDWIVIIVSILLFAFLVTVICRLIIRQVKRRKHLAGEVYKPVIKAKPEVLAFLDKLKVNSRVIWCTIYSLNVEGYINLDEVKIKRVREELLPAETELEPHEQVVLHWLWKSMQGADEISINALNESILTDAQNNTETFLRLQRLLEIYCLEQGWIKAKNVHDINHYYLTAGILYFLLGTVLYYLSSYWLALLLFIPGLTFMILTYISSRITKTGYELIRHINTYKMYLSNISRYYPEAGEDKVYQNSTGPESVQAEQKQAELEKSNYQKDFIYAIALNVLDDYLEGIKYVTDIDTVIAARYLTSLGFTKHEMTLKQKLETVPRRTKSAIREQKSMYRAVANIVKKRLSDMQSNINHLQFRLLFPQRAVQDKQEKPKPGHNSRIIKE